MCVHFVLQGNNQQDRIMWSNQKMYKNTYICLITNIIFLLSLCNVYYNCIENCDSKQVIIIDLSYYIILLLYLLS